MTATSTAEAPIPVPGGPGPSALGTSGAEPGFPGTDSKRQAYTSLTALLFCELCLKAGLPGGVVNVITGAGPTGATLVGHPGIDKVAFTGSSEVGRLIRRATAGSGKHLTLELGGKSPFVI